MSADDFVILCYLFIIIHCFEELQPQWCVGLWGIFILYLLPFFSCSFLETSIGNSKKIWSNNCILGKKHSSINTTFKLDGIHIAEPETISNEFSSYFNSIPMTLSDNININLTAFESYLDNQILESDNF